MRIEIKNNRNGKVENELVKKIVRFYLTQLVGKEKVDGIRTITITFKKLISRRGGYARWGGIGNPNYEIIVNSTKCSREVFRILAHECTHIKQYFTGELFFKARYTRRQRQTVTVWKGREYLRKAYRKQPWEVDARKGEKLACNILNKIDGKVTPEPIRKVEPIVQPVAISGSTAEIIRGLLKDGAIPNGDLIGKVLNGSTDKQRKLNVHREVFTLKQSNVIREVNKQGLIWVELV